VKIFSPFPTPNMNDPVELLQARVEGTQPILWNGQWVDTWLVVYRSDPGSSASQAKRSRGRMWVHPDGTVLRQQVEILGGRLTFIRLSKEETKARALGVGLGLERDDP
jgi:hypothetical protein